MEAGRENNPMRIIISLMFLTVWVAQSVLGRDLTIGGDYVEARTSDVFTGPCFANAEVNLVGQEAILGWRIREGTWEDVPLEGLSVVAVVKASATLGDPHASPYPARTVIVVDEEATEEQQNALISFVRSMGGDLLRNTAKVTRARIEFSFDGHIGQASLRAGDIVELKTRALNHGDHLCGNEEVYYPPLAEVSNPTPAYTLAHWFRGQGLNSTWSSPNKRSAFVGLFGRSAAGTSH